MNEKIKELLGKMPKDQAEKLIESVMGVENASELIEKAKEFAIELTEKEAGELFDLIKKPVQLSEDDLNKVAGGYCTAENMGSK